VFGTGANAPLTTTQIFTGPTVNVVVAGATQKVVVTAHQGFGSIAAGGADGLDLRICSRLGAAGPIVGIGSGIFGLRVAQNTRQVFGFSVMVSGLAPGTYTVGLCGLAAIPANWNSNEFGSVTAMVLP
jgi:hypothetical protein